MDANYNLKAKIKGGQIPSGVVQVSGAKNSATKLLAAALISDEEIVLQNYPTELVDANYKIDFIQKLGGKIDKLSKEEELIINSTNFENRELDSYNYLFRTTYLLVPGLLKKSGEAMIPYPGGCKIGHRGYDLHISAWESFGAIVTEKENYIHVTIDGKLKGTEIDFPISTIGGTETALICGSIAEGKTIIKNAYISPEVNDLISFLKMMGVNIKVIGSSYIEIEGKQYLRGGCYKVMPDRIEAITWIVYGILSGGSILVKDIPFSTLEIPLIHLREMGISIYRNDNNVYIDGSVIDNESIQPFELATGTYPGIISDMQPFFVLLALHASGRSRVYDYRYPERIKYCEELSKMYNNSIVAKHGEIVISGSVDAKPIANNVVSTDLRGSMALLIGALLASGESEISGIDMALRGYNKLEEKLKGLGVVIELIN
ncbi:UDP-N-acetylglucosamine 1-carboxyvinyltransferase [Myroides fluvii]|uniref:UDP-N-acetylglucosamine 1-carboxyvinyltransferase n=1 Tax=Myroides fluvii TaxID=2572594 RepID=UPI00131E02D1|nr:UDP-N-acetylglucosamine 1-carboxyvinyltransferase [Myroides fluvii]